MSDVSTTGRRSVDEGPWFQLLGTIVVRVGDRELAVGSPHQGAGLAALLVDAGQVVGVDTLVERVWGRTRRNGPGGRCTRT